MTGTDAPPPFRLAFVPGVNPGKWARIWNERSPGVRLELVQSDAAEAAALVRARSVEAALLRLTADRDGLHAIPLYTETTVVVVPKDHVVTAVDEITASDLAEEIVLHPLDDTLTWETLPGTPAIDRPATTGDAIELVAAGVGVLVVPQSLARLHHRKDLTYRPVTDAPESRVALSWPENETSDLMDLFIGIVRGRTVNSTRGRQQAATSSDKQDKTKQDGGRRTADRKPTGGKPAGRGRGPGGGKGSARGKPRRRS